MSDAPRFDFGDNSVAAAYDTVLVPILFEPWAARLVEDHGPWEDLRVLDLAAGTGVVTRRLATAVEPDGNVVAVDINGEMLDLARQRCNDTDRVHFLECSAQEIPLPDRSIDKVVCQQGFQFFPDKPAAAKEIQRILVGGGSVVVSTWCPVSECEFFGAICDALVTLGEPDIADMMRVPFDLMPEAALTECFRAAGFGDVRTQREELPLVVEGGIPRALGMAYATPIGPGLRGLTDERQAAFKEELSGLLHALSDDGRTMGRMATHLLLAT